MIGFGNHAEGARRLAPSKDMTAATNTGSSRMITGVMADHQGSAHATRGCEYSSLLQELLPPHTAVSIIVFAACIVTGCKQTAKPVLWCGAPEHRGHKTTCCN